MSLSKNKEQELDKKLVELAVTNFEEFCLIASVDKIQAYVCIEKSKGKSSGTIAITLGVSPQAVDKRYKKCLPCQKNTN